MSAYVSGETRVITQNGYAQVQSLVNTRTIVWDGCKWEEADIKFVGKLQEMIKVMVQPYKNNKKLELRHLSCSKDIAFCVGERMDRVRAYDLKLGSSINGYNNHTTIDTFLMEACDYAIVNGLEEYGQLSDAYSVSIPQVVFNGLLTV